MKKLLVCLVIFLNIQIVLAEPNYKNYSISPENLYYSAIQAINEQGFRVIELQSKNGYILFSTPYGNYLAQVIQKNEGLCDLKLSPSNGNYTNAKAVFNAVFSSLNISSNTPFELF